MRGDRKPIDSSHLLIWSFIHHISCILKSILPGSQFGLTLVLNAEKYEYSRGPFTDIGVKVNYRGVITRIAK